MDASSHGVGAAVRGFGPSGQYTRRSGYLNYHEVTQLLQGDDMTISYYDSTPYAYSGTVWVTYEDETSVIDKCEFTQLTGLNVGLQLISEDLNTQVNTLAKLSVVCRRAMNTCVFGRFCLLRTKWRLKLCVKVNAFCIRLEGPICFDRGCVFALLLLKWVELFFGVKVHNANDLLINIMCH